MVGVSAPTLAAIANNVAANKPFHLKFISLIAKKNRDGREAAPVELVDYWGQVLPVPVVELAVVLLLVL